MTKQRAAVKQSCQNLLTFTNEFPLPLAEMVDERNGIFALRFFSAEAVEKFFLLNFENFSKHNLSTKAIGRTLLVFPHGKAVRK